MNPLVKANDGMNLASPAILDRAVVNDDQRCIEWRVSMLKTIGVIIPLVCAFAAAPAVAKGFQADVHAGVDNTRADGFDSTGATYGVSLAYDIRTKGALVGIQLDADASDNRGCENNVFLAGDRACVDAKRDSALSLRLGAHLSGGSTLYALAGYANGRFEAEYSAGGVSARDSRDLDGVRLGLGLQTSFGSKWYGKAEYRYTNYEDGLERHGGVLGVGLRF